MTRAQATVVRGRAPVTRLGASAPRVDGRAKTDGSFAFANDLWHPEALFGVTVRSTVPHGRITGIDVGAARTLPGVAAVLTAPDIPGRNRFGLDYPDQPVLAEDVVRHVGEPVALIAAHDPATAAAARRLVRVDVEPLPAVFDPVVALTSSIQVHEYGNVVRHLHVVHNDPDAAADVWVDGYYETAAQDQAFLGPEAGLAIPTAEGGIELYAASQWLHTDRNQIAPVLDIPAELVVVHLAGVGGAFGGREDVSVHIHASVLAQRTGRPVRMVYDREESFLGHVHRHPARIWMRHGATRDGRLRVVRARIVLDGGAYTSTSPAVVGVAASFAAGPYVVENALVDVTAVYTHNPPFGAMRGFGAVQACFGHEAQMDRLAAALRMDPVELRLRNALHPGATLPTGQRIEGTAPVRELIEACTAPPLPAVGHAEALELPGAAGNVTLGAAVRRGVGLAVGLKNVALSDGADDYAEATVVLARGPDGPVAEIRSAAAECGQGIHTVLVQIVEDMLAVPARLSGATTTMGSAGSSSASRQTLMSGGAVTRACEAIRVALIERAAARLGADGGTAVVEDGAVVVGECRIPFEDVLEAPLVVTRTYRPRRTERLDDDGQGNAHVTFAFAAHRAVVDVDEELGLVRVVQVDAAQDVGRALNPQAVEGQIAGGIAQGLGLAVMEELQLRDGRILNGSFTDYTIPTVLDMPVVRSRLLEEAEPGLPHGAKGVGEAPTIVSSAAVMAAIRDAVGRDLNRAPASPDEIAGIRGPVDGGPPPPVPPTPGNRPVPEYLGAKSQRRA